MQSQARDLAESITESEQSALQAEQSGDLDSALSHCQYAQDTNRELIEVLRKLPAQPQLSGAKQRFLAENQGFVTRHGTNALEAFGQAHNFAITPRDAENTSNRFAGMGLREDSPEYFSAMKDLLQMYSGMDFNPDETLTPDEAAKISGVSPRTYNKMVEKMVNGGRDSASQYTKQYGRDVG